MNFTQFAVSLVVIVGFALIVKDVNWRHETADLFTLFKKKVRETTKEF